MSREIMKLSEAAAAVQGTLTGADCAFNAVSTDTRAIKSGDLFIALKGERFDGATFAEKALLAGAVGVMVNHDSSSVSPAIQVADTRIALGQLAAHWRKHFAIPVIAITGSNGKTTVKEMTAAILRSAAGDNATLATEGNLNNDIGCPLMMLKLRQQHRYAVLEMGMNHRGEIRYLTQLAKPDIALINNAMTAHIGLLGSVRAIAEAKGEIFEGLSETGTAIINADDGHVDYWRDLNVGRRVLAFGFSPTADVRGAYQPGEFGGKLAVQTAQGNVTIHLQVAGEHNARNALAALACALSAGVDLQTAAAALSAFTGIKGRLQRKPALHGGMFIDDTYNANPDSARAALSVLAKQPGRKILVLGNMGELGDKAPAMHAQIGLAARQAGVEKLYGLGELTREAVQSFGAGGMYFERIEELLAEVENVLAPDVTVLVKGSRAMQMEHVVNSLRAAPPREEH